MSCVLRVSGKALDIDAMLSSLQLVDDRTWRVGECRSKVANRPHKTSGANFFVSDADFNAIQEQVTEAIAYLESNLTAVSKLASFPGVEQATLDFGVELTEGNVAVSSYLPPTLIRVAAQAGVGIEVSTYLCSVEHSSIEG